MIECREDLRKVHLALIGLAARRHRRDLHVANERKKLFESPDEIAADDLGMIEIELDAHICPIDLGDDVGRMLDAGEEIIRPVARIERLEENRDVALSRRIGGRDEVADEVRSAAGRCSGATLPARQ
jgi:hypothetical protein